MSGISSVTPNRGVAGISEVCSYEQQLDISIVFLYQHLNIPLRGCRRVRRYTIAHRHNGDRPTESLSPNQAVDAQCSETFVGQGSG
ncbi:hypothetical protein Moror_15049 [Moniliophthora roreri MCA 2997]|uniref:Uncharacterized protein n=1 Tax=Moniliophthora roreri (strain MCA 2997) TaxID=1381753 RepID=V2W8Z9_MONRO|nr:hypothetical protein Moror_15049 [Moniliophthora roreri MCA 2997]